ncbi:MAG TPA: HAMP domain-containing sensor histidine kinase [Polyangiaceae bacterium]|nr:HAMP domain-containing sensor histidine kinase [Polyangiaceae bacterium]
MAKGRPKTLRGRAFVVVLAVALAPVIVVALAQLWGWEERTRMERAVAEAAQEAQRGGERARIAESHRVRLRVITDRGEVAEDHDFERATSLRDQLGDLSFGPEGPPTLRAYDATLGPIGERSAVTAARTQGQHAGCVIESGGLLLVCHHALRSGESVVLAEKSSPRAIRALWNVRYPILKLTLYVTLVGLVLAAWLARRIVKPVEQLRDRVLDRIEAPLESKPIAVTTRDEIGDLAHAFNGLLAAMIERSRQNHDFMVDLVHELKSPVAAVKAVAEALGEDGREGRLARALRDSSTRLESLVGACLELARAEAGLPNRERSDVDIAELVTRLGALDARIEVTVAPAVVRGVGDELERVLRNLVDNGLSFAGDEGWVRIEVRAQDHCIIDVRDSGPGIEPELLPRVFDRFFTARADRRGTGLGLALAKAIVEAHGGSISADSPDGEGACFTVRLPLVSHGVHTPRDHVSPAA